MSPTRLLAIVLGSLTFACAGPCSSPSLAADTAGIQLSGGERTWLAAHPDITFCATDAFPPQLYLDKNQQPVGYVPDLYKLLGERLGLSIKFKVSAWAQAVADAKDHRCDGLAWIRILDIWKQDFLFGKPILISNLYIYTRSDNKKAAHQPSDLYGKKVAYIGGDALAQGLLANHPQIIGAPYDSNDDLIAALLRGDVEAIIGAASVEFRRQQTVNAGIKVTAMVSESDTYLAPGVRKDWPELAALLNKALDDLGEERRHALETRWYGSATSDKAVNIDLTDAEKRWLARGDTVRVRVSDTPPYMFTRPAPSGLAVDYLNAAAKRIGFKVEYVPDTVGWAAALADVVGARQHYDLLLVVNRSPEREGDLALTADYSSSLPVIIARRDSPFIGGLDGLSGKTIAAERSFVSTTWLKAKYPTIKLLDVDRSVEALQAVATGRADAYVGSLAISSYFIKDLYLDNLMVVAQAPFDNYRVAMGVRKDWPELASLIDKGIATLQPNERHDINQRWSAIEFRAAATDLPKWLPLVALGIIATLILLLVFTHILRRQVAAKTRDLLQNQQILLDSETRFRNAMEATNDGLWDWDLTSGAVYFSPAYFRMLGYEPGTFPNNTQTWLNLVHPDDVQDALATNEKCVANLRDRFAVEFRMKAKDGSWKWILGRGHAVSRAPDGRALRMVGTHVDITERKLFESELRAAKEKAEETLIQLRKTQSALLQSEKMASLGNLTAGIAHEINTPLGIILTSITHCLEEAERINKNLLGGGLRKSELVQFISDINEAGAILITNTKRASELIKSFQHVAADQVSGDRRVFEIKNWLEELVISLRPEWYKRGHQFEIICPADVQIDGYPGMLAQILTNLVVNSVTHAFRGGEHGKLTISITEPDVQIIRLTYSDDGAGIPKRVQGRVFDPFFTTNRGAGNTGLGLHIVYNLVTNGLSGRIGLESDGLKGTRFTIDFPRSAPLTQNDNDAP